MIGLFCEEVPFKRLYEDSEPNLQQLIPMMNLAGCGTVLAHAASVKVNYVVRILMLFDSSYLALTFF